LFKKIN